VATLLEPCLWVAPLELHNEEGREGGREYGGNMGVMVVGLSGRSRLYFGEHLICGAVASVLINHASGFLLFLTLGTRPLLKFISFRALARLDLMGGSEGGVAGMEGGGGGLEGGRAVERGARLVASLHSSPSVLLQLPRGNVELVSPHPMVLLQAARLLDARRYGQAFSVLRRNKLNLNFLIDYSPQQFEREVKEYVVPQMLMREGGRARTGGRKREDMNIFLSAVGEGDCVGGEGGREGEKGGRRREGRGWWCLETQVEGEEEGEKGREEGEEEEVPAWFPEGKRNRVCEMVREALMERMDGRVEGGREGGQHMMECVLTTLAHQSPPRFEEALTFLREVATEGGKEGGKEEGQPATSSKSSSITNINGSTINPLSQTSTSTSSSSSSSNTNLHLKGELASKLLKYLAFFTDMDSLYRVALGMYDVTLARAIGRSSPHMDPREYLPFLEEVEGKLMGREGGVGSTGGWRGKVMIDLFLGRPERALKVMAEEGREGGGEEGGEEGVVEEEEVVRLARKNKLEEQAVGWFKREKFPKVNERLMEVWGEGLREEGLHQQALVVFLAMVRRKGGRKGGGEGGREGGGWLLKAAECARALGDWRLALDLVARVEEEEGGREGGVGGGTESSSSSDGKGGLPPSRPPPPSLVQSWARQFVSLFLGGVGGGREGRERLREGARVCLEYLGDVEGGVGALVKAGEWREAMREARKGGRKDLIETDVWAGVKEGEEEMRGWMEGGRERWREGGAKLRELGGRIEREEEEREEAERERRRRVGAEGGGEGGREGGSVFSVMTNETMNSVVTDASFRSGTSSHASSHSRLTWTLPGSSSSSSSSNSSSSSSSSSRYSNSRGSSVGFGIASQMGGEGGREGGSQYHQQQQQMKRTKKAKRKIKLTLREEEARLRKELMGLRPGREEMEEVKNLVGALLLFSKIKGAGELLSLLKGFVAECVAHPLPPPPLKKKEEEGGKEEEEEGGKEGEEEGLMALFEKTFAAYLFLGG